MVCNIMYIKTDSDTIYMHLATQIMLPTPLTDFFD